MLHGFAMQVLRVNVKWSCVLHLCCIVLHGYCKIAHCSMTCLGHCNVSYSGLQSLCCGKVELCD